MAEKKNKKPQVEAPVVDDGKKVPATTNVKTAPAIPAGMTQHDKVNYGLILQHRKDELKNNGGSATMYESLTAIEDMIIIDIAITETVIRKNPAGLIMAGNEQAYESIRLLAAERGVKMPPFKSLKKPTKEELRLAGLSDVNGEGTVVLALEKKDIPEDVQQQIQEEEKIRESAKTKDYLNDLTKIETDAQLKEALAFQLLDSKTPNPVDRLVSTAQFYRSFLELRAEKAADPQAELDKIHGYTLTDLLQDITTMVPPSFVTSGFGKILCAGATNAKSVVPAFNMLRRTCTNRKTGVCRFSDEEIAALVRTLIVWRCSSEIADISKSIKEINKNISVLNKDAKANAKAIDTEKKKIEAKTAAISSIQDMMSLATEPDFEIADNFIAAYNNEEDPNHAQAVVLFKSVIETYYKDIDIPELEFDTALLNIQQRIGIILNIFNSEVGKRDDYSIDNLIRLSTEPEEETKAEETKNA